MRIMERSVRRCGTIAMMVGTAGVAVAGENMLGRQSQNEGIEVVRRTQEVALDGSLKGWDLSGQIWSFADVGVRSRYSVKSAAMWDEQFLYLAFVWRDPSPMHNTVNPEFNSNDGWKSDSVQLRLLTPDAATWVTTWFYSPKRQAAMLIARWKDIANERNGTVADLYTAKEEGGTDLGDGIRMAYRMDEDGKGFVQEARIPWPKLYAAPPQMKAGVVFRMGMEFLWGDVTGCTWPVHRYADNMQPGKTSREFFWSAKSVWGDAKLVDKGPAEPRKYVTDEKRVEGSIPVAFAVPKSAAEFTVVVEDGKGNRVRNLGGGLSVEDYEVKDAAAAAGTRKVQVCWDGLDEKGGMVPPGAYTVRGLTQEGISSEYEMCFYNPGTPPWDTARGTGAWGADHCPPKLVVRSGDGVIVAWEFAEGGHGIIAVGGDGKKRWGEKRGAGFLATDAEYLYAVPISWHIKGNALLRMDARTGAYAPFVRDGKALPFEYPLAELVGEGYTVIGLTSSEKFLYVQLRKADDGSCWVAKAEKASLARAGELMPLPECDVFGGAGDVFYGAKGDKVYRIDGAAGKAEPLKLSGVGKVTALTTDLNGNVLVMDSGKDQQVKAFDAKGKLAYTCGKKGGRPIRGTFEPQAMREVHSIAVDAKGEVWAVEHWDYPRRVSVWSARNGKLVRDYVGNTGYAGTGAWLHNSDPTIGYVGPVEMKLNKADRTWSVSQIYWVPDPEVEGEHFKISAGDHITYERFTATVGGKAREYMFVPGYRDHAGYAILMKTDKGAWQPVSAITVLGMISGKMNAHNGDVSVQPDGKFAGYDAFDGVFWNDANGDGRVQFEECEIVRYEGNKKSPRNSRDISIPLGSGWGQRIGTDFVFYVNGGYRYRPVRFTKGGAPVYSKASIEKWMGEGDDRGDWTPVQSENRVLCLSFKGYAGPTKIASYDAATGATQWTYPNEFPGVHGSHRATMPSAGRVIGPLKIMGVVDMGKDIGQVFGMRGNLGQDFYMTTDGLYVGTMFQDGRLPGESLPDKEADLIGRPMESYSNGSEPFNGWLGRQADGKIRLTTGFSRQACMILTVKGFETIRRFDAGTVTVSADDLAAAEKDNLARAEKDAPPKVYTVKIRRDGNLWDSLPEMTVDRVGYPHKATVRMVCSADNLHITYRVTDSSPWMNEGKDFTRLFKTGDCVDFQIKTTEGAAKGNNDLTGCVRVVMSQLNGKPAAVLMRAVDPTADKSLAFEYVSPVAPRRYDRVELAGDIKVSANKGGDSYDVNATIPLKRLGITPVPGLRLKADVGFIASDASGTVNAARIYWANKDTNLVSDMPQESWMYPATWGEIVFE